MQSNDSDNRDEYDDFQPSFVEFLTLYQKLLLFSSFKQLLMSTETELSERSLRTKQLYLTNSPIERDT